MINTRGRLRLRHDTKGPQALIIRGLGRRHPEPAQDRARAIGRPLNARAGLRWAVAPAEQAAAAEPP